MAPAHGDPSHTKKITPTELYLLFYMATLAQVVERVCLCSEGRSFNLCLANCVMVILSLGKTLHTPCLVWMCTTAVCLRWWSEGLNGSHDSVSLPQGSCSYYRSLPPPVWLCVDEWNLEPCKSALGVLNSGIQIQSIIITVHTTPADIESYLHSF